MKKLLLASVAVSGLAFAAAPAYADIDLNLGGYFKGYGAIVSQDEDTGVDVNTFDILRDTEVHVGGETTLGNGLTVGMQFEFQVDATDENTIDESYAYFSGNWGRVNFGEEDGAVFLLQVAAPSADSNFDGLRQNIQPLNGANLGNLGLADTDLMLDYDVDDAADTDKLTYLSPVFSGFQVGLSFSPDNDMADDNEGVGEEGTGVDEVYEIAARYEGQFNQVGVIAGAGYLHGNDSDESGADDDNKIWNVGLDLNIGPFGIGAAYVNDNNALDDDDSETDIVVVGLDYTTGPFVIGASYYNNDTDDSNDYDRYTGGVTYEYGPGMTFRGSISHLEVDTSTDDADGTSLLLGTQVNF